jgi:hypothetical protein
MKKNNAGKSVLKGGFPFAVFVLSAILGIASRKGANILPQFFVAYTGDTMWALAFFAIFRWLFPRQRNWEIGLITYNFSCLIELSQLWHPAWLETIRATLIGGLLLGFGFRISDLFCYFAGCLLGFCIFSLGKSRGKRYSIIRRSKLLKRITLSSFFD